MRTGGRETEQGRDAGAAAGGELPCILVLDDEIRSLEALQRILCDSFEVLTAHSVGAARELLDSESVRVILCDQRMPDISGVEFLEEVRRRWPQVVRMIISGYADAHDIIDGINRAGIYQYIAKPWHPENLLLTLSNACRLYELQRENELLAVELRMMPSAAREVVAGRRESLRRDYDVDDGIVHGADSPMNDVCAMLRRVAPFDVSVLLLGESGTGKELAARALHYGSGRWNKPFVVENCGALPDDLLESELFGHKKGAFTGAVSDHVGLFERASGGTVFLDEIGDISPAFQVKLLRVLQEGEIRPLGSSQTRRVDVRVVAATHRDIEIEVREGRFRADLYYRLAGIVIRMPALSERPTDVPVLARAILARAMSALDKRVEGFSPQVLDVLQRHRWPGNVRELQNEVQRMLVLAHEGAVLDVDLLSPVVLGGADADVANGTVHVGPRPGGEVPPAGDTPDEADATSVSDENDHGVAAPGASLRERIESLEARIIREVLIRHDGNKSRAAQELGLSRVGLRSKLERYGLDKLRPLWTDPRGVEVRH